MKHEIWNVTSLICNMFNQTFLSSSLGTRKKFPYFREERMTNTLRLWFSSRKVEQPLHGLDPVTWRNQEK